MKTYDSYKPTKIEFLDAIPEKWEEKRLRFLGYLYGGLTGKSANDFNLSDIDENKYFIPFTNIAGNLKINPDQLQQVIIKQDEKQNDVRAGDLFFLMSSEDYDDVGKSAVLMEEIPETYLNSFCKGLRLTTPEINPEYLNYHLHSKQLRHNLLTEANGFTRINLKVGKVQDLYVAFPDKPEQTAIANYLDRKTAEIDELIADKKRLLELYEEEKTAIINQAITKGINPDAPKKDSGIEWLGEIPEHWEVKRLKHVSTQIGDGIHTTPSYLQGTEIYFINGVNLNNGKITLTDKTLSIPIEEYEKYKIDLKNESLLISLNGTIGKLAFYNNEKVILGKSAAYIELNDLVYPKFIFYILKSQYVNNYFEDSFSGTTIKNLSLYTLRNTPFPYMELEEQISITRHIEIECKRIDKQVERTKKLIDFLKEYREALISEVVTGQIKVIDEL